MAKQNSESSGLDEICNVQYSGIIPNVSCPPSVELHNLTTCSPNDPANLERGNMMRSTQRPLQNMYSLEPGRTAPPPTPPLLPDNPTPCPSSGQITNTGRAAIDEEERQRQHAAILDQYHKTLIIAFCLILILSALFMCICGFFLFNASH